ncbi:hypothetical protein GJU43_20930 [Flavobacterium sp. LC2016-23]|uniref:hypothetical protein n=1 Tax=Flavobacterium sp. LC2016-23 TaxID=2666330 RepID=UPI0012B00F8D|nr:hypothetical protein [Flavobacterium sp. LC2016-23]MRX41754.1 hypothetical protein [Flavobacterium sp. LC2016-23]
MKKKICLTFLLTSVFSYAQGPPPPGLPDQPVVVPVNQMLPVLLVAGIVFGIYVVNKKK